LAIHTSTTILPELSIVLNRYSPDARPIRCNFASPEALRQKKFDRNRPVGRQNDRAPQLAAREFAGFHRQGAPLSSWSCASWPALPVMLVRAALAAGQSATRFLREHPPRYRDLGHLECDIDPMGSVDSDRLQGQASCKSTQPGDDQCHSSAIAKSKNDDPDFSASPLKNPACASEKDGYRLHPNPSRCAAVNGCYYWLRVFRPLVFARKTLKSRHLCLTT
jgi:hypothetical protein